MLLRAYEVYGGETPKNTAAPDYSDFDAVDDWARSSVATLSQWGVMNGSEEGSFSPQGLYTTEQCLVTFLRTDLTGRGGRGASYTYFVYQEGGIKSVDLGLHRIQSGLVETDTISDCFFDDTGRIFCCTITFLTDVVYSYPEQEEPVVSVKQGHYFTTTDTDPLACTHVWSPL